MSSEKYRLDELLEITSSKRIHMADYVSIGVPFYRGKEVIERAKGNPISTELFITPEKYQDIKRKFGSPRDGDILLTSVGTLGIPYYIAGDGDFYFKDGNVTWFRNFAEKVDSKFIYYWLSSPAIQRRLDEVSIGSTQRALTISALKSLEIELPDISTQKALVGILDVITDRIALLRETNATLEAIAQALFKSWFVDFDPVRAKQQGRPPESLDPATAALFPDDFEDTELGPVPKGWRVGVLGDFCRITIGGLWGADDQAETDLIKAISLRGVDLEHLRSNGYSKEAPIRWVKQSALEKRQLSETEVLIAASGAGPCGRTLWAGAPLESIYGLPVIYSNFVKRLDCGNKPHAIYIDRLLAEMRLSSEIWNFINGTSVPNLDDKLLLTTKKIVVPPNEVLSAFASIVEAIYANLYEQKAQTLATLRDTLLPRLISGQLRLPKAEALLEQELA